MGHNLKKLAFGDEKHLRAMGWEAVNKDCRRSLPTWLFPTVA